MAKHRKGLRFLNGIPRVPVGFTKVELPESTRETSMFSRYYKAIIAFVAIAGTVVASTAADPAIQGVWPSGWAGVLAGAGTAIGTALVWLKRNEATVEEAEALLAAARQRSGL